MEDVQIILSALWIALMLTYILGDVLRIFSGDFKDGEMGGMKIPNEYVAGDRHINGDSDYHDYPVSIITLFS